MLELLTPIKTKLIRHRALSQKNRPDDEKPGVQLYVEQQWPTSFLKFFDPTLLALLYERAKGAKAAQQKLDGFADGDDLISLTQAGQRITMLPWHHDMTGYTVTIVRGAGFSPNLSVSLSDALLSKWHLGLKEGMVLARYMIEAGNTPGAAWELFAELTSRNFEMTAKPPEAVQSDIEDKKSVIPPAPTRKPGAAERAAVDKIKGGSKPTTPHKKSKSEIRADAEAAFKPTDTVKGSASVTSITRSPAQSRTARGRDKTKAALAAGGAAAAASGDST